MELDHFFILTQSLAPQAKLLSDLGMLEGSKNHHPGQGTTNRRFFFSNAGLELLYVRDAKESIEGPGRRLRLSERATCRSASPFGLILGRSSGLTAKPFAGWQYQPDFLGPDKNFLVGDNSDLMREPLCIYMPFDPPPKSTQPISGAPFTVITELRVHVPLSNPSPVLETVAKVKPISLRTGEAHLIEVIFNNESDCQMRDLRPDLPLVIRW